jgi:hypothetical protein
MKINNNQKKTLIIWLIITTAALIIWIGLGGEIFTKTQIMIEKQDELMGTSIKEWKNQFVLGLDYTTGFIGILSAIIITFLWKQRK